MTDLRLAATQALEALENCTSEHGHRCNRCDSEVDEGGKVTEALRAAMAEPEPDAVRAAWLAGYTEGEKEALAQPDVPQGWVLVPVEPTQAMLDANGTSCVPEDMAWLNENARQTWAAMLAAAPKGGA